ncbi:MAG TPA: methyltransferase domain-containing protein [Burkholderiaceae bacterium]|nr:methyltransferase domain-containing protein [Burkholderiaceae bacterium]
MTTEAMTPGNPLATRADTRRRLLAGTGSALILGMLAQSPSAFASQLLAQATAPAAADNGTPVYEPRRGQSGKDVIWIPTPDRLVNRMLQLAGLTRDDYLIDLGSGDGKIVIAAARDFGVSGQGIEYNPDMVELSKRNAQAAGVGERARFEKADIFESDFSRATVITMYLLPHLNMKLRHRLLALKPGTRLVSHEFRMGSWVPDETSRVGGASAHLWLVPANVGGDWTLHFPQRSGPASLAMSVEQTFQNFRGRVVFEHFETGFRDHKVHGERVRFAFTDGDGRLRRFDGLVNGDRIEGDVFDGSERARFSAERKGPAPAIGGSSPAQESEMYEQS